MPFSVWNSSVRSLLALALTGVSVIGSMGQDSQVSSRPVDSSMSADYSRPNPILPNPIAPYRAHSVDPPNLSNGPRIESLIKDGKLFLSMNDAVALTLENNLDLAIARYNLNIAETDVL